MMSEESVDRTMNLSGFWIWFRKHNRDLLAMMRGEISGSVTELIDRALAEYGLELTYDLTHGGSGGELAFTAMGNPVIAKFIERFVAAAPACHGWVILAQRPRKTLPIALEFVRMLHGIDLRAARFAVEPAPPDRLRLRIHERGLMERSEQERREVAQTLFEHALGEETATLLIAGFEFRDSGSGLDVKQVVDQLLKEETRILELRSTIDVSGTQG